MILTPILKTRMNYFGDKVEKILKGSLDSIPSPSPSVKIQIMGRNVCSRCNGKTLLGVVNNLLKTKSMLTSPSNVIPCYQVDWIQATFPNLFYLTARNWECFTFPALSHTWGNKNSNFHKFLLDLHNDSDKL